METIGQRIRKVRKLNKMSQVEFSEKLQIHQTHISKVERGAGNASRMLIGSICSVFGIAEDWLIEGKGEMNTPISEAIKLHHASIDHKMRRQDFIDRLKDLLTKTYEVSDYVETDAFAGIRFEDDREVFISIMNVRLAITKLEAALKHFCELKT